MGNGFGYMKKGCLKIFFSSLFWVFNILLNLNVIE